MERPTWKLVAAITVGLLVVGNVAPARALDDTRGREWRQLYETTGLSWNQIASVCPTDGVTPCNGTVGGEDLTGWVWGTSGQVLELLSEYAPELATVDPPQLSGGDYFGQAIGFLGVMRYTVYFVTTYTYTEWTGGWTSSTDASGAPIAAGASFGWHPFSGHFGLGPIADADEVSTARGVFLWRVAGLDYSAPVITPSVAGTLGNNGWYTSDVAVTWDVQDPESPIDSTTGCGPSTVAADTTAATFTCQATSFGGTASASTTVKRDTVAPTIACPSPAPTFSLGQLGAVVTATVSDATSGPASPTVTAPASTSTAGQRTAILTGTDLAGRSTTRNCSYRVVIPPCRGLTPNMIGTAGNDVLSGTAGRDVVLALGGNDTINGLGGDDVICGGDGADTIYGGDGKDIVDGGAGNDEIEGGNANDNLDGGLDYDSIRGDSGRDTCTSGEQRMSSCETITP